MDCPVSPKNEREAPGFRHGEERGCDDRRLENSLSGKRAMVAPLWRYGCLRTPISGVMLASTCYKSLLDLPHCSSDLGTV
jgi:hypothetical protein